MSSESKPDTQRLFFALWPNEPVREQIDLLARQHVHKNGKRTRRENHHITLVFLGSVEAERRACLEESASGVVAAPFELALDRFGYWMRPRILWLGASHMPAALLDLVAQLNTGMQACGLSPETRPFQAHVTLARKLSRGPSSSPQVATVLWPISTFCLIESLLTPEGSRYQVLREWPLTGSASDSDGPGAGASS